MSEFVTVAAFPNPTDAHLAKNNLEFNDVTAVIEDENIIYMNPLYSEAVGGVKVRVADSDEERARDILEKRVVEKENLEGKICPDCGSTKVDVVSRGRRLSFLTILFFSFPVGTTRRKCLCLDCGHTWPEQ